MGTQITGYKRSCLFSRHRRSEQFCSRWPSIFGPKTSRAVQGKIDCNLLRPLSAHSDPFPKKCTKDKNFMQRSFFWCLRHGMAGISRDLRWDVPGEEKLYARKLWADFLHHTRQPPPQNVRFRDPLKHRNAMDVTFLGT